MGEIIIFFITVLDFMFLHYKEWVSVSCYPGAQTKGRKSKGILGFDGRFNYEGTFIKVRLFIFRRVMSQVICS